ncbi:hypothetical protein CU098_009908 [Rhizopus stolonifer]|uniref:Uncharacterized protein n=1 Tax=Rhizopus stolonifer TaxID=4846 RepID=A0A367KHK3_RHIST|nr:hypothetical protein CU098_009908 [Rhizopus stolonifer]
MTNKSEANTYNYGQITDQYPHSRPVKKGDLAPTLVAIHPTTSPLSNQTSSLKEVNPQSFLSSSTAAATTSKSLNKPSTLKRVDSDDPSPSSQNKRRSCLSVNYVKGLSLVEKLQCLAGYYGNDNTLDLVSPGVIPVRFAKVIVKDIPLVSRVGLQSYIYIVLSKLLLLYQYDQLRDTTHKEGGYQSHLYAYVFDAVFLFDPCYVTKREHVSKSPNMEEEELTCCLIHFCRTECHATTIKYLKKMKQIASDEKDDKLDLYIFLHGLYIPYTVFPLSLYRIFENTAHFFENKLTTFYKYLINF